MLGNKKSIKSIKKTTFSSRIFIQKCVFAGSISDQAQYTQERLFDADTTYSLKTWPPPTWLCYSHQRWALLISAWYTLQDVEPSGSHSWRVFVDIFFTENHTGSKMLMFPKWHGSPARFWLLWKKCWHIFIIIGIFHPFKKCYIPTLEITAAGSHHHLVETHKYFDAATCWSMEKTWWKIRMT